MGQWNDTAKHYITTEVGGWRVVDVREGGHSYAELVYIYECITYLKCELGGGIADAVDGLGGEVVPGEFRCLGVY